MDLSEFVIDGVMPPRVERPGGADDVVKVVQGADRHREAIVVFGGGTRIGVGDAPSRYDMALDMRGVRGVVEHSAADLICIVRAGTTLTELGATLARARQRWPVDAALPERATVGGTIASAAPAASRLRYQHVRDWVIGCEAVLGDGTRVRAGGRVVKNVTGYDLSRLYSGSYGTLAALTEVSLKLVAIDERTSTLRSRGRADDLAKIATELRAALPLEAIVLVTGPAPALYVRASGAASAVLRELREIGRRGSFEEVGDDAWAEVAATSACAPEVARLAVPPGREAELIGYDGLAYVGTGIAFAFARSDDDLRALRERCEAMGGALVLERASAERKLAVGVWGKERLPLSVAHGLKERFDPHGVLAPGRMPA